MLNSSNIFFFFIKKINHTLTDKVKLVSLSCILLVQYNDYNMILISIQYERNFLIEFLNYYYKRNSQIIIQINVKFLALPYKVIYSISYNLLHKIFRTGLQEN